ncbi:hypothetical protein Syun_024021 [Stephania yunnanensis]|uniref:Uncharacterized protein n=1 Tax=Stephania yunnanensis TaxID=152371 RepID=A0AAP0FA07_9MAGN
MDTNKGLSGIKAVLSNADKMRIETRGFLPYPDTRSSKFPRHRVQTRPPTHVDIFKPPPWVPHR